MRPVAVSLPRICWTARSLNRALVASAEIVGQQYPSSFAQSANASKTSSSLWACVHPKGELLLRSPRLVVDSLSISYPYFAFIRHCRNSLGNFCTTLSSTRFSSRIKPGKSAIYTRYLSVVVGCSHRQFRAKIIWDKPICASVKYMLFTYTFGVHLAVADSRLPLSLSGGDAERFVSCDSAAHTLAKEQRPQPIRGRANPGSRWSPRETRHFAALGNRTCTASFP
jgi:hypothetical protein